VNIESHVAGCAEELEQRHMARERALALSRSLIRQSARTIRATHRNQFEEACTMLEATRATADELQHAVAHHADLLSAGYTQDALKEYAEAALVYAFLLGHEPPSADDLHVQTAAYLNGLAEAASELRRAILDRLRNAETEQSERLLTIMDDVYSLLMTIDYPEALTGGLRRSTDALRGVLERTRGDVTAALRQQQLLEALDRFEGRINAER
jgi:translin